MKTILYHGSPEIIKKPVYGEGKTYNDYGRGFYCTEHLELAKEWACSENIDGYCNQYEIDLSKLKVLHLSEYTILHWLALLVTYRKIRVSSPRQQRSIDWLKKNYLLDLSEYDVIIGYRADDSYFSFAQDFVAGVISLEKLSEAMRLGKLGEQIVLKSEKAFEQIKYVRSEIVDREIYYVRKNEREREARKEYRMSKLQKDTINQLYMIDIMREGMENDDVRLFRGLS